MITFFESAHFLPLLWNCDAYLVVKA